MNTLQRYFLIALYLPSSPGETKERAGAEHTWFYVRYMKYSKGCSEPLHAHAHTPPEALMSPQETAHLNGEKHSTPCHQCTFRGVTSVSKVCLRAKSMREVSKKFVSWTHLLPFILFLNVLAQH